MKVRLWALGWFGLWRIRDDGDGWSFARRVLNRQLSVTHPLASICSVNVLAGSLARRVERGYPRTSKGQPLEGMGKVH